MKITTRLTIDMATGQVLEHEFYEYEGPVALCGGSSKQNDPAQAATASAGANAQAQASADLSKQYAGQQSQQYKNLFGADGKSGSLSKMMDPASLNVSQPTGAYKLQYNQARGNLATQMSQARGSMNANMQQRGFGANSPSGVYADNARQLQLGQNAAQGQMFNDYTNQSYQDALRNFWGANGMASGQDTSAMQGALTGSSAASQTYANLYGTAAQRYTQPSALGSVLGAVGTLGSAAMAMTPCPVEGSLITMANGELKPVEDIHQGDELLGIDGEAYTLPEDPTPVVTLSSELTFNDGLVARVSDAHNFALLEGGAVKASDSYGRIIASKNHSSQVSFIKSLGEQVVFVLPVASYQADGLWAVNEGV